MSLVVSTLIALKRFHSNQHCKAHIRTQTVSPTINVRISLQNKTVLSFEYGDGASMYVPESDVFGQTPTPVRVPRDSERQQSESGCDFLQRFKKLLA